MIASSKEIRERLYARLFGEKDGVVQNNFRGEVLEEIVNSAIGEGHGGTWCHCSSDWGAWDFRRGDYFLQVKQAAVRQSWDTEQIASAKGRGVFNIRPNSGCFGAQKWISFEKPWRIAQVYVFGWHEDPAGTANHFDARAWKFFVVPSRSLDDKKLTISVNELKNITTFIAIDALSDKVEQIAVEMSDEHPNCRRELLEKLDAQSPVKSTPPSHSTTS